MVVVAVDSPWASSRNRGSLHDDARGHKTVAGGCVLHRERDARGNLIDRYRRAGFIHDSRLFCHDVAESELDLRPFAQQVFQSQEQIAVKAPLVVVTVVVACARASAQQAQIPAASRAAPIFLMFVFILRIRVGARAWSLCEWSATSNRGRADIKPATQPCATVARRADRRGQRNKSAKALR